MGNRDAKFYTDSKSDSKHTYSKSEDFKLKRSINSPFFGTHIDLFAGEMTIFVPRIL
jgi:hypothetical protein